MSLSIGSMTASVVRLTPVATPSLQKSDFGPPANPQPAFQKVIPAGRALRGILLAALCAVAGCQQPGTSAVAAPDPVPVDGIGYLVFNAPIAPGSRDLFMADVGKLQSAGAREIRIGMNSSGGDINSAQALVEYMARLHGQNGVTFKAYNIGLIASAATYVFMNAQDRYSVPRGTFLFHAAGVLSNAPINAQNLRDQADKLDAYEQAVRATMKARTRLTDAEAQTYVRRTVLLNSDDARRDGIVDGISDFPLPKNTRVWVIASKPANPATPAPSAASVLTPAP